MLKTALVAALALVCMIVSADARQRHRATAQHPSCNILWPCAPMMDSSSVKEAQRVARGQYIVRQMGGFGSVVPRRAVRARSGKAAFAEEIRGKANNRRHLLGDSGLKEITPNYPIAKPMRYIGGRLICAVNVGVALAERGIKGTGSALALSYLKWGRSAGGPVPGAVIVSARRGGGHVAIVSRVENGVVYAWNATGGQSGWREIPYRHHVIDYRVPG